MKIMQWNIVKLLEKAARYKISSRTSNLAKWKLTKIRRSQSHLIVGVCDWESVNDQPDLDSEIFHEFNFKTNDIEWKSKLRNLRRTTDAKTPRKNLGKA